VCLRKRSLLLLLLLMLMLCMCARFLCLWFYVCRLLRLSGVTAIGCGVL